MNHKYIFAFILLSFSIIGCQDFLEEDPPTFISTSNFFKTASDARTACDGIYKALNDGSSLSVYGRFWPAIDLATDDVTSREASTFFNAWFSHTLNGEHVWLESWGQYQSFWKGISRANDVLEYVPAIEMDETEKNIILGEARALRAFMYYTLVRTWGDVPNITASIQTEEDFQKPRSSVKDIYKDIIIPDLQFAEANCADGLHQGRLTKWSAKVILAEVYLTRAGWRRTSDGEFVKGDAANWTLARDKAMEVIMESPNALNTEAIVDGAHITPACGVAWYESSPFSKESLFELSTLNISGQGSWLSRECGPWPHGQFFWGAVGGKPLEDEGIDQTVLQMRFPANPATVGLYIPTPDLWNAFEEGDARRDWALMTRYITPEGQNYLCQPLFRKYVDIDYYLGKENTSFLNTNNNFILYRYADALLIYAEAANEVSAASTGDAAYNAVNEIRVRAGLPELADLSQDDFRKAVWKERRCEFTGECKRRFDLIRTNRLATETANIQVDWTTNEGALQDYSNHNPVYTGDVTWPDNEWLMPIPTSEMSLNEPFGWIQNEGY